jgi:hypothetical protein
MRFLTHASGISSPIRRSAHSTASAITVVHRPSGLRVRAIDHAERNQPPCELLTAGHRTKNVEDARVDCVAQRRPAVAEDL